MTLDDGLELANAPYQVAQAVLTSDRHAFGDLLDAAIVQRYGIRAVTSAIRVNVPRACRLETLKAFEQRNRLLHHVALPAGKVADQAFLHALVQISGCAGSHVHCFLSQLDGLFGINLP